jgi:phosphoglycolate phosphatase-like HAD superfamily hydrolase
MSKIDVDTLIVDLDNTLFDWFAVWYASFEPIYELLLRSTSLPAERVEADIRRIHQKRRTSEYTFLINELECVSSTKASSDFKDSLDAALLASKRARDANMRLYPDVFRSLWDIKNKGTKIIAYTESMGFYSAYRLKRFGLDGVIDVLFCPQDHETPSGISVEKLRSLPDEFYELQVTELRHTPPGELKPNPRVLLDIIQTVGAATKRCAYVGDSLFKDVAMARDISVFDIHAKYGESQRKPEYELLRRVSHWTESDVKRERDIIERGHNFTPSATLEVHFSEIFKFCNFVEFGDKHAAEKIEQDRKNALEAWKKTVDVQQHFNDLSMRTRNFAITVVGALIAAVGFTYQQGLQAEILGLKIAAGVGFIIAAAFAWLAFFFMDYFWYHIFLKGAVEHAAKIEARFKDDIPGIELGGSISAVSSNVKLMGFKINSSRRLLLFYSLGAVMIGVVLITLLIAKPIVRNENAFSNQKGQLFIQLSVRPTVHQES